MRPCLSKEEVIKAVEHRSPSRIPMILHIYAPTGRYKGQEEAVRQMLLQYPSDVMFYIQPMPSVWQETWQMPGYSWTQKPAPTQTHGALDSQVAIEDWSQLDEMLDHWPDPMAAKPSPCEEDPFDRGDRYAIIHWWNCLYERAWHLRGMENLLMDFHLEPKQVHRLLDAITDFNCQIIRRAAKELQVNGVWVTEDIGMQNGPMFSLEIFREFFKPYYARMFRTAHECGMHFWLHSCGKIDLFLQDLIDIELDVIHPIQKYTMDEREIARQFGGKVCFWTGMDMQKILPFGTPEDVRREIRFMVDTFDRPDGGCMIALGNVVTSDVPLENLQAMFDEAYNYGLAHRAKHR
jgi:uroporphyrinogen decarboxylase